MCWRYFIGVLKPFIHMSKFCVSSTMQVCTEVVYLVTIRSCQTLNDNAIQTPAIAPIVLFKDASMPLGTRLDCISIQWFR
jgi:hypothetical protein